MNIEQIDKKIEELEKMKSELMNKNEWIKIPELNIEVEKNVLDKNKSWDELKLSEREDELLTAEQCIWIANSNYAKKLKMDGSSDDFFIQQPFNLNKKKNYVAGFVAGSGGAFLICSWGADVSNPSLGVRLVRKIRGRK